MLRCTNTNTNANTNTNTNTNRKSESVVFEKSIENRKKMSINSGLRICIGMVIVAALVFACTSLPLQDMLKDFLIWTKQDLGPWGPLVLILAYIPLTVLAVPASVITLGCGYLFGLPLGIIVDSIGSTSGATAAFILGRTIGRSYVNSKLKEYPKFRAVSLAIKRSGFKIIFLLRLVPLLPFNILNYLLSVTPVSIGQYVLASWLGMIPITFVLVYFGTTLKDLSDVTSESSSSNSVFVVVGFVISVILMVCITKVAKSSLDKTLAEVNEGTTDEGSEHHERLLGSPNASPY